MMGPIGGPELIIILIVVILLFGASRVADLGGALGKSIKEFRSAVKGDEEDKAPKRAERKETTKGEA